MTREPSSSSRRDLHSFGGGADGEAPIAGLFDANGVLCGTTAARGKYSDGTAFAMATAGSERAYCATLASAFSRSAGTILFVSS